MPVDIGDTKFINGYGTSTIAPPAKVFKADSTEVYYDTYPFMGVLISTAAGAAVTFDFEASVVVEVIGKNVTGKTPSHADPSGLAAVHSAIASHPHTTIHHGLSGEGHAVNSSLGHLTNIVSTVGQGLNGLAGATNSLTNILQSANKPQSSGKSGWDILEEIWKGVSSVAPIVATLLA